MNTSHYIHQLDPYCIHIGNGGIRWYGMFYFFSFIIAGILLSIYSKKKRSGMRSDLNFALIEYIIAGVIVGGRLGYMLFYRFHAFIESPLEVFEIWKGGMSSHGGFIGVCLSLWFFSRRYNIHFFKLTDILSSIAPSGLFLGRIANFINGELWGKVTSVSWGVIFPASMPEGTALSQIPPRHPSQLYEAFGEGILLFLVMQWLFWKKPRLFNGVLTGIFLVAYAIVRIIVECFREPDASLIMGMTRGQFYSLFFLAIGIILTCYRQSLSQEKK